MGAVTGPDRRWRRQPWGLLPRSVPGDHRRGRWPRPDRGRHDRCPNLRPGTAAVPRSGGLVPPTRYSNRVGPDRYCRIGSPIRSCPISPPASSVTALAFAGGSRAGTPPPTATPDPRPVPAPPGSPAASWPAPQSVRSSAAGSVTPPSYRVGLTAAPARCRATRAFLLNKPTHAVTGRRRKPITRRVKGRSAPVPFPSADGSQRGN